MQTSATAAWFHMANGGGLLQQPARCHGSHGVTDNQMVEHPDIDQLQCRFQTPGNPFVCLRGFTDFGGVIVGEDDGCGIQCQRLFDHFPRIDGATVDRASEHFLVLNNFMPVVQKDDTEDLVFGITEHCLQVGFGITGTADGVTIIEALQYAMLGALDELVSLDRAVDPVGVSDAEDIGGRSRIHRKVLCRAIDVHHDHTALSAGLKYFGQTGACRREAPTQVQPKPAGLGALTW